MFKRMGLAGKIGGGFLLLIVMAASVGGLAVWSMGRVKTIANKLVSANVPEVAIANEIERDALSTMYQARGYTYTDDPSFLERAKTNLEQVKKDLLEAKDHAERFDLAVLKQNAGIAETKALQYERLLAATVPKTESMNTLRTAMNEAADKYMQECAAFLKNQSQKLDDEITSALTVAKGTAGTTSQPALTADLLKERAIKIATVNEVVDLGNAIRIGNWKAQNNRDLNLLQETQKTFEQVNRKLDELKAITRDDVNLKQLEACRAAGKAYNDAMTGFLSEWSARDSIGKERGEVGEGVLQAAKDTAHAGMEDTTKASAQAASSLATASATVIIGLSVAMVLSVLLALFISRGIVASLKNIFKGLRTLSRTELDETAVTFKRIIDGLTESVGQVNDAAGQVAGASQQLAEGASEQASSLEETSSALEQMAAMTRTNAANAKAANDLAGQARAAADGGDKTMGAISESSGQISKIIKVIEEIAFQTNLLALNAAVEAARAGEHGKGFAVVADEVRNLAQRAAQAARETTGLIENSVNKSKEGTEAIKGIVANVGKLTELITGISKASDEQAQGVEQVNTAVSQMDKVTQQNASGAEESASAAEELSAQAESVSGLVAELMTLVEGDQGGTYAPSGSNARTKTAARPVKPSTARNPQPKERKAEVRSVGTHSAGQTFPLPNAAGDHEDMKDF